MLGQGGLWKERIKRRRMSKRQVKNGLLFLSV